VNLARSSTGTQHDRSADHAAFICPRSDRRQQIAILKEEGVNLKRVKIDHLPDTTDIEYIAWVAEQGCTWEWIDYLESMCPAGPRQPEGRVRTIKA